MSGVRDPGTYFAGVYHRLVSTVQGHAAEEEHMVNVPNWLVLDVRLDGTQWWSRGGFRAGQPGPAGLQPYEDLVRCLVRGTGYGFL